MIIPEPKDLPPNTVPQARKLTTAVQDNVAAVKRANSDANSKFKQLNVSLQNLSEQVLDLQAYIGTLPAATAMYVSQTTAFTLTTSYTAIASVSVPVPAGYTRTTLMVVADGIFKDPTAPYMTDTLVRLSINGVNSQPMSTSWSATPSVGAADCFHVSDTAAINGTASIPVNVNAVSNVAVESSSETFARLSVFAIFT